MSDLDILTPEEARQFLARGVTDANNAGALALGISAVSQKLDEMCGPVVTGGTLGTITGELHNGGCSHIYLDYAPLRAVVEVVEYTGTSPGTLTAETNTSKPAAGYHVETKTGKVTRRNSNTTTWFPGGLDNISVTYVRGRYETTADVDERFKFAAGEMLKANWRMFESAVGSVGEFDVPQLSFPSFSVPKAVKEWLGDEWRRGIGI